MANFKQDILSAVQGQEIEAIHIRSWSHYWSKDDSDPRHLRLKPYGDKTHQWKDVEAVLDFDYSDGYGSQDCPDVYVYTVDTIYYVHEYDGSTCFHSLPRHP